EKIVYVYDFDIVVDKYTGDEATGTRLSGAKFVLLNSDKSKYYYYNEETKKVEWNALGAGETLENVLATGYQGNTKITEVTTDNNGAAKFQGLDSGTYYLHETEAPAGYNLLKGDVTVTITATYNDDGTLASSSATSTNNGQYQQTQKVENKSGTELPSTGGMGTTIFYVLGSILVVGAAVVLITKKRMSMKG
ncbi:MAG: SpaA isopeptide-forming pilin-related protein, partial [Oscillospiraceae bacterium]|nr:SpaA isopeptide-forming pilin-related protein [Oscillospiraceae bacterium]